MAYYRLRLVGTGELIQKRKYGSSGRNALVKKVYYSIVVASILHQCRMLTC